MGTPTLRFSLRWLFVAAAVAGLGAAALMNANLWWIIGIHTFVVLSLFYTAIRAALLGRRAPFSIGYSVVGWIWMASNALGIGVTPEPKNLVVS